MSEELLRQLRAERDRFVGFSFAAADLLVEIAPDGKIVYASGAAHRLTGRDARSLVGGAFANLLSPGDRPMWQALYRSIEAGGRFSPTCVMLGGSPSTPAILGGCTLPGRSRSIFLTLSAAVPARAPAEGGGMLSREAFLEAAAKRIEGGAGGDYKLSFVAVEGLDALRERVPPDLARGLTSAVERQFQAASPDLEAAAEVSGGRYGLLHKGTLDTAELTTNIETFTKAIDPDGTGVVLSAATLALDNSDLSEGDAARALVFAVNAFAEASPEAFTLTSLKSSMSTLLGSATQRISSLRSTVDSGAFLMAFQPIVQLTAPHDVHHVEALVRIGEGDSPASTVAFAEASGLITDLDMAICQRVMALLAEAKRDQAPIAINISGRSLESQIFCKELLEFLDTVGPLTKMLLVEITETAHIPQIEPVNKVMQALRKRGCRICLDDFGSGASALHYLRGFEADFVKIDGDFARAALAKPRDRSLLRSIIEFCREIQVQVIVEQIETEDQAGTFRKLGAPLGQGYLFGKPVFDHAKYTLPQRPPMSLKRKGSTETWM